jgi:FkbM family methyltransferase
VVKLENINDLIEVRDIDILGETNWHWIKSDVGCFGDAFDGPMRDWIDGHRLKYFTHVRGFDTIVTGGTSCGMHVRFYAKMFKHVYAFEPDPVSFHCMTLNAPYQNVYKLNAAIVGTNHPVNVVRHDPTNVGMNQVQQVASAGFQVPGFTIDSLNLQKCDLIQLDVEGFETDAIKGAIRTINKFKPVIIGERFGDNVAQAGMSALGYKLADTSFMDSIYIPR